MRKVETRFQKFTTSLVLVAFLTSPLAGAAPAVKAPPKKPAQPIMTEKKVVTDAPKEEELPNIEALREEISQTLEAPNACSITGLAYGGLGDVPAKGGLSGTSSCDKNFMNYVCNTQFQKGHRTEAQKSQQLSDEQDIAAMIALMPNGKDKDVALEAFERFKANRDKNPPELTFHQFMLDYKNQTEADEKADKGVKYSSAEVRSSYEAYSKTWKQVKVEKNAGLAKDFRETKKSDPVLKARYKAANSVLSEMREAMKKSLDDQRAALNDAVRMAANGKTTDQASKRWDMINATFKQMEKALDSVSLDDASDASSSCLKGQRNVFFTRSCGKDLSPMKVVVCPATLYSENMKDELAGSFSRVLGHALDPCNMDAMNIGGVPMSSLLDPIRECVGDKVSDPKDKKTNVRYMTSPDVSPVKNPAQYKDILIGKASGFSSLSPDRPHCPQQLTAEDLKDSKKDLPRDQSNAAVAQYWANKGLARWLKDQPKEKDRALSIRKALAPYCEMNVKHYANSASPHPEFLLRELIAKDPEIGDALGCNKGLEKDKKARGDAMAAEFKGSPLPAAKAPNSCDAKLATGFQRFFKGIESGEEGGTGKGWDSFSTATSVGVSVAGSSSSSSGGAGSGSDGGYGGGAAGAGVKNPAGSKAPGGSAVPGGAPGSSEDGGMSELAAEASGPEQAPKEIVTSFNPVPSAEALAARRAARNEVFNNANAQCIQLTGKVFAGQVVEEDYVNCACGGKSSGRAYVDLFDGKAQPLSSQNEAYSFNMTCMAKCDCAEKTCNYFEAVDLGQTPKFKAVANDAAKKEDKEFYLGANVYDFEYPPESKNAGKKVKNNWNRASRICLMKAPSADQACGTKTSSTTVIPPSAETNFAALGENSGLMLNFSCGYTCDCALDKRECLANVDVIDILEPKGNDIAVATSLEGGDASPFYLAPRGTGYGTLTKNGCFPNKKMKLAASGKGTDDGDDDAPGSSAGPSGKPKPASNPAYSSFVVDGKEDDLYSNVVEDEFYLARHEAKRKADLDVQARCNEDLAKAQVQGKDYWHQQTCKDSKDKDPANNGFVHEMLSGSGSTIPGKGKPFSFKYKCTYDCNSKKANLLTLGEDKSFYPNTDSSNNEHNRARAADFKFMKPLADADCADDGTIVPLDTNLEKRTSSRGFLDRLILHCDKEEKLPFLDSSNVHLTKAKGDLTGAHLPFVCEHKCDCTGLKKLIAPPATRPFAVQMKCNSTAKGMHFADPSLRYADRDEVVDKIAGPQIKMKATAANLKKHEQKVLEACRFDINLNNPLLCKQPTKANEVVDRQTYANIVEDGKNYLLGPVSCYYKCSESCGKDPKKCKTELQGYNLPEAAKSKTASGGAAASAPGKPAEAPKSAEPPKVITTTPASQAEKPVAAPASAVQAPSAAPASSSATGGAATGGTPIAVAAPAPGVVAAPVAGAGSSAVAAPVPAPAQQAPASKAPVPAEDPDIAKMAAFAEVQAAVEKKCLFKKSGEWDSSDFFPTKEAKKLTAECKKPKSSGFTEDLRYKNAIEVNSEKYYCEMRCSCVAKSAKFNCTEVRSVGAWDPSIEPGPTDPKKVIIKVGGVPPKTAPTQSPAIEGDVSAIFEKADAKCESRKAGAWKSSDFLPTKAAIEISSDCKKVKSGQTKVLTWKMPVSIDAGGGKKEHFACDYLCGCSAKQGYACTHDTTRVFDGTSPTEPGRIFITPESPAGMKISTVGVQSKAAPKSAPVKSSDLEATSEDDAFMKARNACPVKSGDVWAKGDFLDTKNAKALVAECKKPKNTEKYKVFGSKPVEVKLPGDAKKNFACAYECSCSAKSGKFKCQNDDVTDWLKAEEALADVYSTPATPAVAVAAKTKPEVKSATKPAPVSAVSLMPKREAYLKAGCEENGYVSSKVDPKSAFALASQDDLEAFCGPKSFKANAKKSLLLKGGDASFDHQLPDGKVAKMGCYYECKCGEKAGDYACSFTEPNEKEAKYIVSIAKKPEDEATANYKPTLADLEKGGCAAKPALNSTSAVEKLFADSGDELLSSCKSNAGGSLVIEASKMASVPLKNGKKKTFACNYECGCGKKLGAYACALTDKAVGSSNMMVAAAPKVSSDAAAGGSGAIKPVAVSTKEPLFLFTKEDYVKKGCSADGYDSKTLKPNSPFANFAHPKPLDYCGPSKFKANAKKSFVVIGGDASFKYTTKDGKDMVLGCNYECKCGSAPGEYSCGLTLPTEKELASRIKNAKVSYVPMISELKEGGCKDQVALSSAKPVKGSKNSSVLKSLVNSCKIDQQSKGILTASNKATVVLKNGAVQDYSCYYECPCAGDNKIHSCSLVGGGLEAKYESPQSTLVAKAGDVEDLGGDVEDLGGDDGTVAPPPSINVAGAPKAPAAPVVVAQAPSAPAPVAGGTAVPKSFPVEPFPTTKIAGAPLKLANISDLESMSCPARSDKPDAIRKEIFEAERKQFESYVKSKDNTQKYCRLRTIMGWESAYGSDGKFFAGKDNFYAKPVREHLEDLCGSYVAQRKKANIPAKDFNGKYVYEMPYTRDIFTIQYPKTNTAKRVKELNLEYPPIGQGEEIDSRQYKATCKTMIRCNMFGKVEDEDEKSRAFEVSCKKN